MIRERNFPRRRLLAGGILTAVALAALSGCAASPGHSAVSSSGQLAPMVVSVVPSTNTLAPYIALDQGYFAKEKLPVTVKTISSGAALVPALESNSVQLGSVNLVSALQGVQRGLQLKCLAGTSKVGKSLQLLLAPKLKGQVTDGAGLEGKSVAVNSLGNVNQLLAEAWVGDHDGDPAKVKYVAMDFPDMPAAVQSGQVDAAIVTEPFVTRMVSAGVPVLDPSPIEAIKGDPVFNCWAAYGPWVKSHPREVAAFRAAMHKVDEYIATNPDAAQAAAVAHLKLPRDLVDSIHLPHLTSAMAQKDLTDWKKPAEKYGLLKPGVDAGALIEGIQ